MLVHFEVKQGKTRCVLECTEAGVKAKAASPFSCKDLGIFYLLFSDCRTKLWTWVPAKMSQLNPKLTPSRRKWHRITNAGDLGLPVTTRPWASVELLPVTDSHWQEDNIQLFSALFFLFQLLRLWAGLKISAYRSLCTAARPVTRSRGQAALVCMHTGGLLPEPGAFATPAAEKERGRNCP